MPTYLCPTTHFCFDVSRGFYPCIAVCRNFCRNFALHFAAFMAWTLPAYKTGLRRLILTLVILVSLGVIVLDILEEAGNLKNLISGYLSQ